MNKFGEKKRGGIEPIPEYGDKYIWSGRLCRHPEHNPPMHISIPDGHQYRHICPGCGAERVIRPQQITFQA